MPTTTTLRSGTKWSRGATRRARRSPCVISACARRPLSSGACAAQSWGSLVDVAAPEGSVSVDLKLPGRHNVVNALGAIAAATAAGASLDAVAQGLADFRPIAGRLQAKTGRNGATLIDDSYNANPDSVRAAIAVLVHATGSKWMVLGDMGEVGEQGAAFHREIGECARAGGVDRLLTLGDLTPHAVDAFGPGGEHFASSEDLIAAIESDAAARRHRAGQGLALHAHGTHRRGTRRRHGGRALMLLALANWIATDVRAFNVFTYITLRSVLATMTALVISFVIGPRMIRKLTEYKIGQSVRDDGPQTHLIKAGTPTMGGALILVSIIVTTLLWADLRNRFVWVVLLVTLGFGTVGWVDDYRKVVQRNPKGLSAGKKLLLQSLIGLVAAIYLAFSVSAPSTSQFLQLFQAWLASGLSVDLSPKADLIVPFFKTVSYPLGVWGFIILSYCVIVGSSNAVNLTDGLDGLAIMPTVMVGAALGLFAYVAGRADFSTYLFMPHIPGAGELTVVCAAIAGAGLGFLWFNAYPAEVFMGDVGALALGAALGAIAVIVRQEIVLFIMGGVFVVETLSVMIQVASFKLTGKRVFRMAPIHHHYELKGWKENQVVVRFWIITMLLVLFGLSTLKLR